MNPGSIIRNTHLWLPGYLEWRMRARRPAEALWVTIADHFEPLGQGADEALARSRVAAWRQRWPDIAARHLDSAGRHPRYTFFYPQEEYRPELLEPLAEMTRQGIADVEVHLHHDGEGERDFVERIQGFTETLHHWHGLLRKRDGKLRFGFIHGNWALDNSRPDGRWCGLNNEITLLRDLGCYADFTLPSAPSPTQTRIVNTLYWAKDDPAQPKSHDSGEPLRVGGGVNGDLLMIPGPLGPNWKGRRRRLLPRVEAGELAGYDRVNAHRAALWLRYAPQLGGHLFLKLFTHGAQERNMTALLAEDLDRTFALLEEECARRGLRLYFASAWEMARAVEALRTSASLAPLLCSVASDAGLAAVLARLLSRLSLAAGCRLEGNGAGILLTAPGGEAAGRLKDWLTSAYLERADNRLLDVVLEGNTVRVSLRAFASPPRATDLCCFPQPEPGGVTRYDVFSYGEVCGASQAAGHSAGV